MQLKDKNADFLNIGQNKDIVYVKIPAKKLNPRDIQKYFFLNNLFVQGGSPTPHPFSSRPHFVCKFSRQRSTEVF